MYSNREQKSNFTSSRDQEKKKMYPEIVEWSTNIRNQQNWVSPAEKVDLEDFEGDAMAYN